MSAIPVKRLLVYLALGMVVLLVGVFAVLALQKGEQGSATEGLIVLEEGEGLPSDISGVGNNSTNNSTVASSSTTTIANTIFVQVAGAVRRPGVYQMKEDSRVFQAVEEAGGFLPEADQQVLNLAASLTDGCRVYVPSEGELTDSSVGIASGGVEGGGSSSGGVGSGGGLVSINSATLDELTKLPGVGPSTAQKIITYREQNGSFRSVEELIEVPGIGPAKLEQLLPLVGL